MEGNVGLAFGMVAAAGACTSLGAGLAFVVNLEVLLALNPLPASVLCRTSSLFLPGQSKVFLAVSLALSAGVMIYVSMVEIFVKSLSALSDEYCPSREVGEVCSTAYGATTGYFFAGLAITSILNMLTSAKTLKVVCGKLGISAFDSVPDNAGKARAATELPAEDGSVASKGSPTPPEALRSDSETCLLQQPQPQPLPPGWQVMLTRGSMKPYFYHAASREFSWTFPGLQGDANCACDTSRAHIDTSDVEMGVMTGVSREQALEGGAEGMADTPNFQVTAVEGGDKQSAAQVTDEQTRLNATGVLTGLAIAIHNFPEGLATFVAAMAEPSLGAAIAVAIAIHNIPEGVCVAMPIYYATGSRLRAFIWATLSGVSEPVGALFGYIILGGDVSNTAYGSMFGLVAGMMVYISLVELLPSAYRFAASPAVVTAAMIAGMAIMAASLLAFNV